MREYFNTYYVVRFLLSLEKGLNAPHFSAGCESGEPIHWTSLTVEPQAAAEDVSSIGLEEDFSNMAKK
jgi:hypothetical protein